MAKGSPVVGVMTGKIGSMVGYRVTNSNDKVKQGFRSYVAHPGNPQSYLQAAQRVKVANIARVYGALKHIVRRGFEAKKYGGMSYLEFLRLNLQAVPDGPWVPKNYLTAVPAAYVLSKGTLPSAGMRYDTAAAAWISNLASIASQTGQTISVQAFTNAIIAANPQLQDGDQLTFIVASGYEGGAFEFRFASVVLDTTNITTMLPVTAKGEINVGNTILVKPDENFGISDDSGLEDETVVGAALIISRDGDDVHLRSTETMGVYTQADSNFQAFFGATAKQKAIASFMAASSDIDWPTEQIVP